MEIRQIATSDIAPYPKNAKKHPPSQVEQIAESIRRFGWQQPLVLDKSNVVIIGHGRLMAAKLLGLSSVPAVYADKLSAEEVQALRLADNKLNESPWDVSALEEELSALNLAEMDMSDFGFDLEQIADEAEELEERHQENKEQEQYDDANILQLEKAQFLGVGEYEIPEILPERIPEVTEWIGFNYMLSEKNPEGKGVHCFVNDYQFERLWRNPDRYIEKLQRFACVASPDFSPYSDMPFCLQLFNHYRKHWVARYLQEHGVHVVPTIRASQDPRSKRFYLDGEPCGGSVIISSMWTSSDEERRIYEEEYNTMFDTLEPERVYVYGKLFGWERGNIIQIPTFAETRFREV